MAAEYNQEQLYIRDADPQVTVVDYSEKAVAMFADENFGRSKKEHFKTIGGKWNSYLTVQGNKYGGWIFPKTALGSLYNVLMENGITDGEPNISTLVQKKMPPSKMTLPESKFQGIPQPKLKLQTSSFPLYSKETTYLFTKEYITSVIQDESLVDDQSEWLRMLISGKPEKFNLLADLVEKSGQIKVTITEKWN